MDDQIFKNLPPSNSIFIKFLKILKVHEMFMKSAIFFVLVLQYIC